MANNLKDLSPALRKEIANSPALLDFMVAAYGVRGDLVVDVRATDNIKDAEAVALGAAVELGTVHGKTLDDVYLATGDSASGPKGESTKCTAGTRWDPITQTCVPV